MTPLISVMMPTRNRPLFLAQAVRLFQAQDYPRKELLIVDTSDSPSYEYCAFPDIRYLWLSASLPTGTQRNLACAQAQGDILVQQDDDDYFGPGRLSYQVAPLVRAEADMSALVLDALVVLAHSVAWRATTAEARTGLFGRNCHTGTLMFLRSLWGADSGTTYRDVTGPEDSRFFLALSARGARLAELDAGQHFVYMRHDANSWQWSADQYLVEQQGWQRLPLTAVLPPEQVAFYRSFCRDDSSCS